MGEFIETIGDNYRQDWNTPACVLERVRQLGPIALDPCSNPNSIVHAAVELSREKGDDGLAVSWLALARGGLAFVNPPYGREIGPFIDKIVEEAARGVAILSLTPARVDTWWFARGPFGTAQAICFWRGRLIYGGGKYTAKFPAAITYWGRRAGEFSRVFSDAGVVVGLRP